MVIDKLVCFFLGHVHSWTRPGGQEHLCRLCPRCGYNLWPYATLHPDDLVPEEQEPEMSYPTMKEVEEASHVQLGRWYRFLESPNSGADTEVLNLILERFNKLGGWTPGISKQVGWG